MTTMRSALTATAPASLRRKGLPMKDLRRAGAAAILLAAAAALGGCQNYPAHSVIVGSVPQDYRTNHPIIVSEQEQTLDVPVASGDRTLTHGVSQMIRGFADRYRHLASGIVRVMVPHGSLNTGAATFVAPKVRRVLVVNGVPASRIITVPYDAGGYGDAPIRIGFMATTAHTRPCGHWPADLTDDPENRGYENFGCATQSNLAAQIANPSDLIAPRGMTPIDSQRRTAVYDNYVSSGSDVAGSN